MIGMIRTTTTNEEKRIEKKGEFFRKNFHTIESADTHGLCAHQACLSTFFFLSPLSNSL
jgi:hypothetical protein